jgi:hypothetical protein
MGEPNVFVFDIRNGLLLGITFEKYNDVPIFNLSFLCFFFSVYCKKTKYNKWI